MNKTVKRSDLAEILRKKVGMTDTMATETIVTLFEGIKESLKDGDTIDINGFGKFEISERSARKGINPATKEPIDIPASNVVKFKPSKALKDAINDK